MVQLREEPESDPHEDSDRSFPYTATNDAVDNRTSFVAQFQSISVMPAMTKSAEKRFGDTLEDVMVATGASRGSTSGKLQYHAYCYATGRNVDIDTAKAAMCHFSIVSTTSLGVAKIDISIGGLWISFYVHVVDTHVSILMSIDKVDQM